MADENKEPLFSKIVTKSFTRFARNTDSLILNLSLTLAQEESANISERTKFGNKATAKANKIMNNSLYGYVLDKATNSLMINEDEVVVVRKMFELCIQGYGYMKISQMLPEEGIYNFK